VSISSSGSSLVLEGGQPYLNFINSLRADETKNQYTSALAKFISKYNLSLQTILTLPTKDIEQMITTYITNMNARGLSRGYVNLVLSAILHFFDMNDVLLNRRKISKFLGEYKKMNKDRAYEHEEIKKLYDMGDFRFKALVLLLASTGVRIGSICDLKLRHLEKKDNGVYKITIYENTKDEYYVFTTPEATNALDQYLDYRKRASEQMSSNSPLFRNDFDMSSIEKTRKNSRPISLGTIRNIMFTRLIKSGLIDRPDIDKKGIRHRNDVPMSHGFRKFWMNQAVKSKLNPEIREMLLGHRIGIASSYYRPTEDEMLAEFEKAIDVLTINPENRLKRKVELLTIEKSKVDLALSQIEEMKKRIGLS
jgi:integrase